MAPRVGPPFLYTDSHVERFRNLGEHRRSLRPVSNACSAVSLVTFFAFGIGFGLIAFAAGPFYFLVLRLRLGLIADAVVSCLCLVIRARHTARTLLN